MNNLKPLVILGVLGFSTLNVALIANQLNPIEIVLLNLYTGILCLPIIVIGTMNEDKERVVPTPDPLHVLRRDILSCTETLHSAPKFKGKKKLIGGLDAVQSMLVEISEKHKIQAMENTSVRQTLSHHIPVVLDLIKKVAENPEEYAGESTSSILSTVRDLEQILSDFLSEVSESYRNDMKNKLGVVETMLNRSGYQKNKHVSPFEAHRMRILEIFSNKKDK